MKPTLYFFHVIYACIQHLLKFYEDIYNMCDIT